MITQRHRNSTKPRRAIAGIGSMSLVAGLVAVGVVATATPAAADYTIPVVPPGTGNYTTSKDNPNLAAKCGLEFGLVLDSSGSIGTTGIANLKTAANAFVDSLVNTGSKVAITSFSASSPGSGGVNKAATDLTTANLSAIKASYSGLNSNGRTNWQDGLLKMQQYFPGFTSGKPDMVIVITDGNPNWNNSGDAGADGSKAATDPAITIANAMKTAQPGGTHMFTIAVGSVRLNPIKAITSETEYTGTNLVSAGYTTSTDYAALKNDLEGIAADLCGATVTVTKQVKKPGDSDFAPASGWNFSTRVTIPNAAGKWVDPNTNPTAIAAGAASTRTKPTGGDGKATFKWQPQGVNTTTPVVVSEDLASKPGYQRDPNLVCTKRNVAGQTQNFTAVADGNGDWNLTTALGSALNPGDVVSCTAKNTLTKLNLKKTVSTGSANPSAFQLKATPQNAPGAPSYDRAGNYATYDPIWGGVTYVLSEAGPAGYSGAWSCDGGTFTAPNEIVVPKGTQVRCTVSNTRDKGTLKVTKVFDKPAALNLPNDFFKVNYVCQDGVNGVLNFNGAATPGQSKTVENVPTGECEITEQALDPQSGWTWGTPSYNPKKVVITKGGTGEAKVTNTITRNTGELLLVKEVEGGSAEPGDWTLTAKNDPSPEKNYSEPGDNTEYREIWAQTPYTLGEDGPGNYQAGDWSCEYAQDEVELNAVPPLLDGKVVTVPSGARVVCTIVNTREIAELKLVKQVDGADPNGWTLTAKAGAPDNDKNVSVPGGAGTYNEVYAGTEYTLGETGPGGYSPSDWVCKEDQREVELAADGQLNTGDKITLERNQRVTCTIVNTRDRGSLTIAKEFNALESGFTGTFDINYSCVDGTTPVKSGTVSLGNGQTASVDGLPTGTVCTVSEPNLPAAPAGWSFNPPTFDPANGQATITTKNQAVTVRVVNSITQVNPEVVRKPCPINPTMTTPKPKLVGNRVLLKKVRTNGACVIVKPVVLCKPVNSSAAGESTFCDTKSTKGGRVKVKVKGYEAVRVTVVVRAKPKPGNADEWKPKTWRKSWVLRS